MKLGVPPQAAAWVGALVAAGCMASPRFLAVESDVAELKQGALPASEVARISERLADLGLEVAELRAEVRELRGEVEVARHAAAEALERGEGPRRAQGAVPRPGGLADSGTPPERPEAQVGAESSGELEAPGGAAVLGSQRPPPSDEPAGGEPAASGLATSAAEVRDYEDAFRIYRAGDFRRAIDRFEAFLQTHPSSDYSDNALFWMGECYFKLGDHERAVLVFEDVVKRYPDGNKVPDALYRQGRALLEIGARRQETAAYAPAARQVFERIVREYPASERVLEAQRELERLAP